MLYTKVIRKGNLWNTFWETTNKQFELDLNAVKDLLDSDHYGLLKVEQRSIKILGSSQGWPILFNINILL